MRKAPGIVSIEVGYAGGPRTDVKYQDVETGKTGHDPTMLGYASR